MKLGAGEDLLRTYDYYTSSDSHSGHLVLTNRRVVSITADKHGEVRSELRVKDIRSIETGYHKITHSIIGLLLIILGAVLAVVGIADAAMNGGYASFSVAFIVLGIILAVIGIIIYIKKSMQLFLVIGTNQLSGYGMSMYATNDGVDISKTTAKSSFSLIGTLILLCIPVIGWAILASRAKGGKSKKIKIKIDEIAAVGILDDFSSVVWELQAADKE